MDRELDGRTTAGTIEAKSSEDQLNGSTAETAPALGRRRHQREIHQLCTKCGSKYEPHTDRSPGCTVCMRYANLMTNGDIVRRDGASPGRSIDLAAFAEWFANTPHRCSYCGIPELLIQHLALRTSIDRPLSRLGLDRVDTRSSYRVGNIALSCYACNKARSNTFTAEEMAVVGRSIAHIWVDRLADVGITWEPEAIR